MPKFETAKSWYNIEKHFTKSLFDSFQDFEKLAASKNILISIDFSHFQHYNTFIPPATFTTNTLLFPLELSPIPLWFQSEYQKTSQVFTKKQLLTRWKARSRNILVSPITKYSFSKDKNTLLSKLKSANSYRTYKQNFFLQSYQ